jgi:OHCU decarboxylase
MNDALARLNNADTAEAESIFRDCCGSSRWAGKMVAARPFMTGDELINAAVAAFNDLDTDDWLEAFAAHPKIGQTKISTAKAARSTEWSAVEQAGMNSANELLKQELAAANHAYHEKFGFIFIICATGKSAPEMLEACRLRLSNDSKTEVNTAAKEQQEITEIRLRKLLSQ